MAAQEDYVRYGRGTKLLIVDPANRTKILAQRPI